mmetsp:Transcript_37067/g.93489  ORF Transcript_37067/g.93489 Transcript_37067/m.93489 type:complete len:224 (+) Transcript_37067:173-844(+)
MHTYAVQSHEHRLISLHRCTPQAMHTSQPQTKPYPLTQSPFLMPKPSMFTERMHHTTSTACAALACTPHLNRCSRLHGTRAACAITAIDTSWIWAKTSPPSVMSPCLASSLPSETSASLCITLATHSSPSLGPPIPTPAATCCTLGSSMAAAAMKLALHPSTTLSAVSVSSSTGVKNSRPPTHTSSGSASARATHTLGTGRPARRHARLACSSPTMSGPCSVK